MRRSRSRLGLGLGLGLGLTGCFLHPDAPASCPGDRIVVLASQSDVRAFATCTRARGVVIRTGATVDVSPLQLETISGDLVVGPTVGTEAISLTELREVGGAISVAGNGSLKGLFLPRLERAGRIVVEGNVSLMSIALPRLEHLAGGLAVSDNHDLEVLDANALVEVGGDLVIANQPELTVVELGSLRSVAAIRIERVPKLPAELADTLRTHAVVP